MPKYIVCSADGNHPYISPHFITYNYLVRASEFYEKEENLHNPMSLDLNYFHHKGIVACCSNFKNNPMVAKDYFNSQIILKPHYRN